MNHISIEEILSFLQIRELNDTNKELICKINNHLYHCEECRKDYELICNAIDEIELHYNKDNIKTKMLEAYLKSCKKIRNQTISQFFKRIQDYATEIFIFVDSYTKITSDNLLNHYSFYHPILIDQLKTTGSNENKENTEVLLDENNNQISISQDGTLSLKFCKGIYEESQMVFLIPKEEEKEILFSFLEIDDMEMARADFLDILPGNYKIIIA